VKNEVDETCRNVEVQARDNYESLWKYLKYFKNQYIYNFVIMSNINKSLLVHNNTEDFVDIWAFNYTKEH
jgi:hypothetical protein